MLRSIAKLLRAPMPRRPRLILPNVPLHISQRTNNRQACFYADDDYHFYLGWLRDYADKTGCQVHAYVLMTNHVHLLLSAPIPGFGRGADESAGSALRSIRQPHLSA
jgi:hypothetical protein